MPSAAGQFIPKCVLAACGLLLGLPGMAHAQASGYAALTSDYVWRGSSQTQEEPGLQASFRYGHDSGVYASAWAYNVRFSPDNGASSEFDLAVGWSGRIAPDWTLDLYFPRYEYPSTTVDLDWNELNAALTWRDRYWLAVAYSGDAMASDETGTYILAGARYPLAGTWRLEATLARYLLASSFADDYTHGSLGVVWAFQAPFEIRLTLHDTDAAAERLFPGLAGSRAELALQASF